MSDVKEVIKLLESPSENDIALVTKACDFAKKAHEGHSRYSGEPYFNHLFQKAKSLAQIGMGPNSVSVGFLHDSIEDVGITPETIKK